MHILIIPSWYPTEQNKINGIFFQEQAKAIAKYNENSKVGVISATYLSSTLAIKTKNYSYGMLNRITNNLTELSFSFPAIPKNKYINHAIASYMCKKLFFRYVQKNGLPDIIHLHSFEMGELVVWIKDKYNIPFVYTEHASAFYRNNLTKNEKKTVYKIIKNSSANFAVSQELSRFLAEMFNANFEMMPNFIDTEYFKCKDNQKEDIFTFINIAGLSLNKNHTLLLQTFNKFQKIHPRSKLLICGDGPEKNVLKSLVKELNLMDKVIFKGKVGRNKVKTYLCSSHCFILSSKVETFGVVAIEAMSCGLPVISTKNGGTESIITNHEVGILCEQKEEDILDAMKKVYQEYQEYDNQKIRNYIINNFSEEAIVSKLIKVYEKVIK